MCVRISQLFQFQVAYRMKNWHDKIVYVHVYVCVCAWQMVAHICLIALAAKGLRTGLNGEKYCICQHVDFA